MTAVVKPVTQTGPQVSRRGVLAGIGAVGGLTFCIASGIDGFRLIGSAQAQAAAAKSLNPWVRILPDGSTFIYSAGAEMGQGSLTSLAAIVADEMDADWSKVTIEFAPSEVETYGYRYDGRNSMSITGSHAVQFYYENMRVAGAQVRKVLIAAAAENGRSTRRRSRPRRTRWSIPHPAGGSPTARSLLSRRSRPNCRPSKRAN